MQYHISHKLTATWLTLNILFLISGCSQAQTSHTGNGPKPKIYVGDIDFVYKAAVIAAQDYFHRTSIEHRDQLSIEVDNTNFWAGDTWVKITLSPATTGGVEVNVSSKGKGINQPTWNRSEKDVEQYFVTLDKIMFLHDHDRGKPL